ncbi:3-oxoacyl-ACP synthase III family protein [Streptomyces durhamensis]|uniref:3-oxoacyl-ACP synthase III family protein n=1 Tax=Streptomyces durhamensis TaxID=68194 RepID=UPI0004CD73F6|nr:3-oxoacyl-[acyl-carrier-protein] synthase III C-terminal domain-containing protein [Streptomyces durhamensis]
MTKPRCSTIRRVAVHVPADRQTGTEIEDEVRSRNPGVRVMPGILRQMYGFEERRVAPPGSWPSDLAAAAGRRALDQAGLAPDAVDLLIFASVSEDVEEPATAHVVAHKLGVTAPVFDVQNACNGVLNALEIADALIRAGRYTRVLVATGELGSRLSALPVRDRGELALLLPALTLGDLGAALLVEASDRPGIRAAVFCANSSSWPAATVANPYLGPSAPAPAVRLDSAALAASFAGLEARAFEALHATGRKPGDLDLVCVHQPSVAFTHTILDALGVPEDKVVPVFTAYGNVATVGLPLQLAQAERRGRLRPGDLVALFGLASGASGGLVLLEWNP